MTTTPPEPAVCSLWPMDPACATAEWDAYDADVKERALLLASATLSRLTGGRVSNCPITVRPNADAGRCWLYRPDYLNLSYGAPFNPINWRGEWMNCVPCDPEGTGIPLPEPVSRVDEVKVNGSVIDPSQYTVVSDELVWVGEGDAPWPKSQDVTKPDTEPGTFSVTYLNAYPVDALGAYAVGLLALEYAKSCTGGSKCRLPSNVTNIVRQGVSMQIVTGAFPGGLTGIREVDAYTALWNPGKLVAAPTVWTPDMARARRV